jgi:hypothetical protein
MAEAALITNSRKKRFNFICFVEMREKMPKISASHPIAGRGRAAKSGRTS